MSFNAYDFERFYHVQPTEETRTLPPDYVPRYDWLTSAVAQNMARLEFNRRFCSGSSSLGSGESNVTFVTVRPTPTPESARLLLVQARMAIEAAQRRMDDDCYTWDEIEPYLREIQRAMKAFEKGYKPPTRQFFGFLRKHFGDNK